MTVTSGLRAEQPVQRRDASDGRYAAAGSPYFPFKGPLAEPRGKIGGPQPLRVYYHGQQAAALGTADSIHCVSRSGSSSNGGRTATGPHRTRGRAGGEAI